MKSATTSARSGTLGWRFHHRTNSENFSALTYAQFRCDYLIRPPPNMTEIKHTFVWLNLACNDWVKHEVGSVHLCLFVRRNALKSAFRTCADNCDYEDLGEGWIGKAIFYEDMPVFINEYELSIVFASPSDWCEDEGCVCAWGKQVSFTAQEWRDVSRVRVDYYRRYMELWLAISHIELKAFQNRKVGWNARSCAFLKRASYRR